MKIVFFGDTDFSAPAKEALEREGYDLVAVIGKKDGSLKDESKFDKFKSLDPDLAVVADYGRIIPQKYLEVPKYKFINIHPSLLPQYRGPSPIQSAILAGEKVTGVTIMLIDPEVDHGPILKKEEFNINNYDDFELLHSELSKLGAKLLIQTIPEYVSRNIKPIEQDHSQATFTKMFTRENGKIDWNNSTLDIFNQTRALNPEPGTWCLFDGKILNIKKATLSDEIISADGETGHVIKNGPHLFVKTADGILELLSVQIEGKKEMSILDFINGHPNFVGSKLK